MPLAREADRKMNDRKIRHLSVVHFPVFFPGGRCREGPLCFALPAVGDSITVVLGAIEEIALYRQEPMKESGAGIAHHRRRDNGP
jgi:hypothetical protein